MLIFSGTPKARVLAHCPKATCKHNWTRGCYVVSFGCEVTDFNGRPIRHLVTGTRNPAGAWERAAMELRLDSAQ